MKVLEFLSNRIIVLSPEQRARFQEYLPSKVYSTERNVSLVVVVIQLCMIALFLWNGLLLRPSPRVIAYFCLYLFLLSATCLMLVLYRYTVHNGKLRGFLWLRRAYAAIMCIWVLAITALEQQNGGGLVVFSYMLPTTAAVLLLDPLESGILFGTTWVALMAIVTQLGSNPGSLFGDMVNGTLIIVLAVVISLRYYAGTVKEFCDRQLIEEQYEQIIVKHQLLEKLARMDQLTGLYNRYYLQEMVYPMFDEYRRTESFTMCLMLDIDYFKQYNDWYGHQQGDVCLRNIAELVQTLCREEDAPAVRYGGEEFLILKMSNQPFDAQGFARRLRQQIAQADLRRTDVSTGRITVSMGLWYSQTSNAQDIECAIKWADDALYQAKDQGRDCIVVSSN